MKQQNKVLLNSSQLGVLTEVILTPSIPDFSNVKLKKEGSSYQDHAL